MKFTRNQTIKDHLYPKRALIIYGPRRVGKTTMLKSYLETVSDAIMFFSTGDDRLVQEVFASQELRKIRDFAHRYDVIALDEAQQIPNIGMGAKMLIDDFPEKNLILTGSSSLYLASEVGEPLTGRHFTMTLLPLSLSELEAGVFEIKNALEQILIYGSYPEVLLAPDNRTREKILTELTNSYLYKDALAIDNIKSPDLLKKITSMIAYQIGSEVSLNEIANTLDTSVHTVERYLDLLEKMFVIKKVRGFSRNLRNEISKKARYYFLDNGVRNAVIGRFNPLDIRDDVGMLWENFCFMELNKLDNIAGCNSQYFFWRTHQGQEVDIIREYEGQLFAYECKWGTKKIPLAPRLFSETYPDATYQVLSPNNLGFFLH